jgi:hypothetical protein
MMGEGGHADELNTVCLFLGPYRNLTSLTAVMLWLHPQCQVLNHGFRLVGAQQAIGFMAPEDSPTFHEYVDLLIDLSTQVVGNEECSPHALRVVQENAGVEDAFERLHGVGVGPIKKDPLRSLVWKDSQIITNLLLNMSIMWDEIFDANGKVRFLMPYRNPMECAVSNHRQRKWIFFPGIDDNSATLMVRAVLAEFAWFTAMERRYPDHFFHFYEDLTQETLRRLQAFLGLDYNQEWVDAVLGLWRIRHPYVFSNEFVAYYASMVRLHFAAWPDEGQKLLDLIDQSRVGQLRVRDWDRFAGSDERMGAHVGGG